MESFIEYLNHALSHHLLASKKVSSYVPNVIRMRTTTMEKRWVLVA